MSDHDRCGEHCHMCDRGYDNFGHVHLPAEDAEGQDVSANTRVVVLCIPCIAALSGHLGLPIQAYLQGGAVFDSYGRRRSSRKSQRHGGGERTPTPKWAADALRDIQEQADGND